MRRTLRRYYGAGPAHLVGLLACFAVAAYAVTRVLGEGGVGERLPVVRGLPGLP